MATINTNVRVYSQKKKRDVQRNVNILIVDEPVFKFVPHKKNNSKRHSGNGKLKIKSHHQLAREGTMQELVKNLKFTSDIHYGLRTTETASS